MTTDFRRPVTLAVTGTHSTGKSSFLQALSEQLRRDRIEVAVVSDLGAEALAHRLPILDRHTWASTLWFISRGMASEAVAWMNADVVLVDRPVPDALAYYEAALEYRCEQPDLGNVAHLEALVIQHVRNYDLILRTILDPTIPLDLSKPRGTDLEFRALADRHVAKVLERHDIEHDPLLSHGHTRALIDARAFIRGRLDGADRDTEG
ncbi:AAA family ATPase [Nocardia sp. CNY236]|uniref:AAA family ATPase n=1 Tax=Nocardia sp. CNY236 TaxID=1169152 RepID=UPI0018CA08E2|nr:AAA family ATPase [Nocardia sp. CNY236]